MSMNDTQKNILEKLDSEGHAKKLDEMYDEIWNRLAWFEKAFQFPDD